jgi:hypothetical protein
VHLVAEVADVAAAQEAPQLAANLERKPAVPVVVVVRVEASSTVVDQSGAAVVELSEVVVAVQ